MNGSRAMHGMVSFTFSCVMFLLFPFFLGLSYKEDFMTRAVIIFLNGGISWTVSQLEVDFLLNDSKSFSLNILNDSK